MGAPYGTPASDFSKSSLAHSIILIDGEGQVHYSSPVFHNQEAYRHFLFVRKSDRRAYVVIFDDMQMDNEAHQYDWLLQTGVKNNITAEGQNHHTISEEAELHIMTLEPEKVDMSQSDSHDIWRTMRLTAPESKKPTGEQP